jgi:hypothetical protein
MGRPIFSMPVVGASGDLRPPKSGIFPGKWHKKVAVTGKIRFGEDVGRTTGQNRGVLAKISQNPHKKHRRLVA